ncbi:TonB-dependent receptor domain-containing protein [Polluticaenibacter yanchengensis]|uniref:Outer membrane beta-barrel family protein n=1 Tax=Polluticaenibacter yanchengensis TaxID=3014562 RepID=A0ABT4UMR9_9BACT|nr:outer membrane beta-barrel family protein [Chitinophagaceae bacterium LY-5]
MKQFTVFLILILCQAYAFSQQYTLKGMVKKQNNEPTAFVYLRLLKQDSVLITQNVTDSLGTFAFKVEKGSYRLVLEQFGTELKNLEITVTADTLLEALIIDDVTGFDNVTVMARRKLVEQKVDRLVFHVEKSTAATGGNALDALKATPTVRVQNESISIAGKGQVLIMIDERIQRMPQEDLANFLKSIPADNIKSIEVITTPPAKYEAEGNSGIINIILKSAKANSWNANIGTSYTQRTYASGNVQGLFNYNYNKLSFQASVSKGKEKLLTSSDSRIFYAKELWQQAERNKSVTDLTSVNLGADYKLNKKWTSGVKYSGSFTNKNSANNPFTTRLNNITDIANAYIASAAVNRNKPEMHAVNWYHSFNIDSTGKNITVDFDYFNYRKDDNRSFSGNELDKNRHIITGTYFSSDNSNLNSIKNYSGKIDIALPNKWANISAGAKTSYTNTNNDLVVYDRKNGVPILNTEQSNVFNYKEYNQAIYFSMAKKLNEKWESQLGLRMEATQTTGFSGNLDETHKNDYIKLFPTAYVTYVPNDHHSFSLNYSRRIRRPDFDYLNPFVIRNNPYSYSDGNPYLKPSYIDNIEFSFIKDQKWVSNLYYSQVSDFGQMLSVTDPNTNITRTTPLNYANTYQVGISTYYNFNKWAWWNSFTGFNMNYQHVKSKTGLIASVHGYNGYIYTNNDFTLNGKKTVFAGVNYGLQLPGRYQIFNISTLHILDVSVKFLLSNKNLSLTITGEDLLKAQRPLISYYSNGIKNDIKSYSDTRGVRVSLSYKFGNNNIKVRSRDFGNDDIRSRSL